MRFGSSSQASRLGAELKYRSATESHTAYDPTRPANGSVSCQWGRRPSSVRSVMSSADRVWPHHLVVLVLDDVAMPHVASREVEQGLDPGDLVRVGDDHVFVARLPGFRRPGVPL